MFEHVGIGTQLVAVGAVEVVVVTGLVVLETGHVYTDVEMVPLGELGCPAGGYFDVHPLLEHPDPGQELLQ